MGDSPRSVALEKGYTEAIELPLKREESTTVSVNSPLRRPSWSSNVNSPPSRNANSRSSSDCTTSEEDGPSSDDNSDSRGRSRSEIPRASRQQRRSRSGSLSESQLRRILRVVTSFDSYVREACQIQPENSSPTQSTRAKEIERRAQVAALFEEPDHSIVATPNPLRAPASDTPVEEGRGDVGKIVPTPLPISPVTVTPKLPPREETASEDGSDDETSGRGGHAVSSPERRPREEADIEEGGEPATNTVINRAAEPDALASAAVDVTAPTGSTASTDTTTIVLPCAPSDEEKVSRAGQERRWRINCGSNERWHMRHSIIMHF